MNIKSLSLSLLCVSSLSFGADPLTVSAVALKAAGIFIAATLQGAGSAGGIIAVNKSIEKAQEYRRGDKEAPVSAEVQAARELAQSNNALAESQRAAAYYHKELAEAQREASVYAEQNVKVNEQSVKVQDRAVALQEAMFKSEQNTKESERNATIKRRRSSSSTRALNNFVKELQENLFVE